jgi:hypothetical protein
MPKEGGTKCSTKWQEAASDRQREKARGLHHTLPLNGREGSRTLGLGPRLMHTMALGSTIELGRRIGCMHLHARPQHQVRATYCSLAKG